MTIRTPDLTGVDAATITSQTEVQGDWSKASNAARLNTTSDTTEDYLQNDLGDVGSADMYTIGVVAVISAYGEAYVCVRGSSGAFTFYNYGFDTDGVQYLQKVLSGAVTNLQTNTSGITPAANDVLKCIVLGDLLMGYYNGSREMIVAGGSAITTGQRGGIAGYRITGTMSMKGMSSGAFTDLLYPVVLSSQAQVPKTTETTTTVAVPAEGQVAGRMTIVHFTGKTTGGDVTAPAGEGWTRLGSLIGGTNLYDTAYAKVWGLGGQTDNTTTGNFTATNSPTTNGWGYTVTVVANPQHSLAPWTSVAAAVDTTGGSNHAAADPMVSETITPGGAHATILRFFGSSDDNNHINPSPANTGVTYAYGGTTYQQATGTTDYAQSLAFFEDQPASASGTLSMAQGSNGPDTYDTLIVVLKIPPTSTPISGSDTGAGAEAVTSIGLADADVSAATVDAGESIAAPTADADIGAGADTNSVLAVATTDPDLGSGADVDSVLAAALSDPEASSGGDTESTLATATADVESSSGVEVEGSIGTGDAEAVSGNDAEGSIGLGDPETGGGTEGAEAIAAALSDPDVGAGQEAEGTIGLADVDQATGGDTESDLSAALSDPETSGAADTEATLSAAPTDDQGATGVDSEGSIGLADPETGSGVDVEAIAADLADPETAGGTEAEQTIGLTAADLVTAVDAGEDIVDITGPTDNEPVHGDDAGETIAVTLDDPDTGQGDDQASTVGLADQDTASGTEAEQTTAGVADQDTATVDDVVYELVVFLTDADQVASVEAEAVVDAVTDGDTAVATELEQIVAALLDVDLATALEMATVDQALTDADVAHAVETGVVNTGISRPGCVAIDVADLGRVLLEMDEVGHVTLTLATLASVALDMDDCPDGDCG